MTRKRVLAAMSGGVDSSVTAYLLKQAGYECLGATMLLHGDAEPGACGSGSDADDAAAIARRLGFSHEVIDLRATFERRVVEKFVRTYEQGRTPNPCIDCNRYLKFDALLDYARDHGCDYIATGHYARIRTLGETLGPGATRALHFDVHRPEAAKDNPGRIVAPDSDTAPGTTGRNSPHPVEAASTARALQAGLLERIARAAGDAATGGAAPAYTLSYACDPSKDQSYVLYSLTQERLAHTLLPLGGLFKERDVRRIAREQGFENASKRDSQGICFVPGNDFATYIERRRGAALPEGDIVNARGEVLGRHQGAIRYTVGQRKGLGVACAHPVYVTGIDAQANTVTLGEVEDLMASGLIADDWIWSAPAQIMEDLLDEAGAEGLPVSAKIRYRHPAQPARLRRAADGQDDYLEIAFDDPERGVAPGQAVVVYAGEVVLGGGTVVRATK